MLKSSKHKGKAKIYPQVKMTDTTRSSILSAFTPSGLSILLGLLLVFVIVGGGIGYFAYKGSGLERDVAYYQNAKSIEAEENIDTYFDDQQEGIRDNRFLSNIPLLFFWGAIGLIAYLTVSSLVRGVGEVDVFVRQLDFVNASRAQRIKEAVLHLAVRVSAAIAALTLTAKCRTASFIRWARLAFTKSNCLTNTSTSPTPLTSELTVRYAISPMAPQKNKRGILDKNLLSLIPSCWSSKYVSMFSSASIDLAFW